MTGSSTRRATALERWELLVCRGFVRWQRHALLLRAFRLASRAGDGMAWYPLMVSLPLLYGLDGHARLAQVAVTGAVGALLYRLLKQTTRRLRPVERYPALDQGIPPLDRFSFPSGHTLHAVAFTTLFTAHDPLLGWALVPLTALIAVSRLVLGLHYPSDVLAGAAVGLVLAQTALAVGTEPFRTLALNALGPLLTPLFGI